jgi:hypothetical protein
MSTGYPRTALLALCLALAAAHPAPAMTYKDQTERDLGKIFDNLAAVGKFNILYPPFVSQLHMKLNFQELEPREAVELVAKMHHLRVREITPTSSYAPMTLVVGKPEDIALSFDVATVKVVRLAYARAATVRKALHVALGKQCPINISQDEATNALLVAGPVDVLGKVEEIIRNLDLPVPQMGFEMAVIVDGHERTPVWSSRLELRNGFRATFALTQEKATKDPRIGKLAGSVVASCNKDLFLSVELDLSGTVEVAARNVSFSLTDSIQLKDGEERVIYTNALGEGHSVSIRVKPVVSRQPAPPEPAVEPSPAPSPNAVPKKLGPDSRDGLSDI